MKKHKERRYRGFALRFVFVLALAGLAFPLHGQLFNNLQALGSRLKVGDPTLQAGTSEEGPKGLAVIDLDRDGQPDIVAANVDGTVTIFFGTSGAHFTAPVHLQTGGKELRGIVCADLTGDGRSDIAAASPYAGDIYLFVNQGGRNFAMTNLHAWQGARNLAAGDFDGDGRMDLAVAGTTNGVQQWQGTGGGNFNVVATLTNLAHPERIEFPKPLYALATFRPAGASRDELMVTHTESDGMWLLGASATGVLEIKSIITNQQVYALAIGPILSPGTNLTPDLVTAHRNLGTIEILPGVADPRRFNPSPAQTIHVPGGPRAVQIADFDRDGWNDLVVVLRNFDRVLTYKNSNGTLVATTEMPVGTSPRELGVGDFNRDGRTDIAVMNRSSEDISVLLTYPGQVGFAALDQIYPVDGEVAALSVRDFNKDGRDDVVQLHRSSGDFSVRLANTNGLLGAPTYYSMGNVPGGQASADINNDGIADMVSANMGRAGLEPGSISVRLGDSNGTFRTEERFFLPTNIQEGRFFSIVAADFNNDTNIDLAVGFFDCRVAFFQGNGDGTFKMVGDNEHLFIYEARAMVVGDFDKDGDIDLAGAGFYGGIVVVENEGNIMTATTLKKRNYAIRCCGGDTGGVTMKAMDLNGDGDLDLLVGSNKGTTVYLGLSGMEFELQSESLPGTQFPTSAIATADFDGDGREDIAVSCRILSCVSILTKDTNGVFIPAVTVDVPAGGFVATGDLDGDGKPDLVGSGSVLWTALSSHAVRTNPPVSLDANRPAIDHPVINEILAINTEVPISTDGHRASDFVELYNSSSNGLSLAGWSLAAIENENGQATTNRYTFPNTAFFGSRSHVVVICSETRRTPYHTGFKLPGEGATLCLFNPNGQEVDRVNYGSQQENVSYARYKDGLKAFTANPYPSPARPNTDNGPVEPILEFDGFDPAALRAGEPIRFFARGRDDVGIVGVSIVYRRLDRNSPAVYRVPLYDDGMNGDGGMLDGLFSGVLNPPLPAGAEIQFYVEVTDLSDQTIILPDEPVLAGGNQPVNIYSLALNEAPPPPLEISELVAVNTSLPDERGTNSDWIEIRNCSTSPVPLAGIGIAQNFFSNTRFVFTNNDVLAPGEHRLVFCDNSPTASARFAPFRLNGDGDKLVLTGTTTNGARTLIDWVDFGPQQRDIALARLGCDGDWFALNPTPRSLNIAGAWLGLRVTNDFVFAYPTRADRRYVVETTASLSSPNWQEVAPPEPGDGLEKTVRHSLGQQRFYRVREQP